MSTIMDRTATKTFVLIQLLLTLGDIWASDLSEPSSLVWGPGLRNDIALPARYFFIQAVAKNGEK